MDQRGNGGTRLNKDRPSKGEGTGRNLDSSGNLQRTTNKTLASGGEEEKKKNPAPPPPPVPTPDLDRKMFDYTVSPPHRLTKEHQGTITLPVQESTPKTKLSFATLELASTPGNGNIANINPFEGKTIRIDLLHGQMEEPGEGWTFQGKRRLPVRILSPRQDMAETLTHSPQSETTPGGKRGLTHSELHHSYFESLGISVLVNQEFCKARIWSVLSREKDGKEQILVHTKNQTPPNLPLSIQVMGPSEERWTHVSAQEDLIRILEAELEEKILRYKMAVKGKLHLEWSWQAKPGRGGMDCTILAHIRTGSSAFSVQNKQHLHWKEIGTISAMNNDIGSAVAVHNLLFKKDHLCTEHLVHKQKMASILASPHTARKKRFVKLELGSLEANPPPGANPFQARKVTGSTVHHGSAPNPRCGGIEGLESPPPTPTSHPILMPTGGIPPLNPKPDQGIYKGSIG
ncbi:unnamed protein product [Sphagnum balticum]